MNVFVLMLVSLVEKVGMEAVLLVTVYEGTKGYHLLCLLLCKDGVYSPTMSMLENMALYLIFD